MSMDMDTIVSRRFIPLARKTKTTVWCAPPSNRTMNDYYMARPCRARANSLHDATYKSFTGVALDDWDIVVVGVC